MLEDPRQLIGQYVVAHPSKNDQSRWSIFPWRKGLAIKPQGVKLFNADTIRLEDCEITIPHYATDKTLRHPEKPVKGVYTYIAGKVIDVNFSDEQLNQIISSEGFKPITYNPTKHRDYIYKDEKTPSYWHTTPELDVVGNKPDLIKKRAEKMKWATEHPEYKQANVVTKSREKNLGEEGYFYAKEMVGRIHSPEDVTKNYMWVKGVHY